MKHPITNLHDLVELGIKLHRQGVPRGFKVSVKVDKVTRENIFSEMLQYDVDYDVLKISNKPHPEYSFYNFKILGMEFHLL